jgi:hypothetical protein
MTMRLLTVMLCALCLMPLLGGCDKPTTQKEPMTTKKFEKLVKDKQGQEVIQAVGKPGKTQKIGGNEYWYYDKVATDPTTGKPASAQLVFPGDSSGWCRTVNWN